MWEQPYYRLSVNAARQHGLITQAQANRVGVDDVMLAHFQESGLIHRLDWSVYQISGSTYGPRYSFPYAAWLAMAPESFRWERPGNLAEDVVLSHESACALVGFGSLGTPVVRFTSATERPVPRAVRVEVATLTQDDVMVHEGVPVTTPHRTILDLVAESAARDDIARVVTDAIRKNLVSLRLLYEDLTDMANEYRLPTGGVHFIDYFMPEVRPQSLSPRNLRAYAELALPQKVAEVRPRVDRLLRELRGESNSADGRLAAEIAAEIAGRTA